jgi:hypothetical protein
MIDELMQLVKDLIREDQVSISTDDLIKYVDNLPPELAVRARKIISKRKIKEAGDLKSDHYTLMTSLATWDPEFSFSIILERYRSGINPVRALYYEAKVAVESYNHDDPYYLWIIETLLTRSFHEKLIKALKQDIKSLEMFIAKYFNDFENKDTPIELFHVMYTLEDYVQYVKFFQSIKRKKPEEF